MHTYKTRQETIYPICYLHLLFFACQGQPLAALATTRCLLFLPAASGITGNPIFRDDRRSDKLQAIELWGHLKRRLTVVVGHMWNENKRGGDDCNPKIDLESENAWWVGKILGTQIHSFIPPHNVYYLLLSNQCFKVANSVAVWSC